MRIAFDMDGVLADMDGGLTRLAEEMFGRSMLGRKSHGRVHGTSGKGQGAAISGSAATATSTGSPEGETSAEPGAPPPESVDESLSVLERLSPRQETQLWRRVAETSDFWMSLGETEAGIVAHLGRLAKDLRWEVIFVTQRPSTSGQTVQRQTQRWLRKHGFEMPSVYTTRGSRGKIAAALTLDALVDDRLQNCVDVATESRAWSIYVARGVADVASIEVKARRMGIAVVSTLMEALDKIEAAERTVPAKPEETGLLARLRKSFGAGGKRS